jgi:polysaccharide export outer membrane protein
VTKSRRIIPSSLLTGSLLTLSLGMLVALGAGCAAPHRQSLPLQVSAISPAVTEINRALISASASGLQGRDHATDYQIGPEDLLQITLFNVPEQLTGVTPRRMEVRVNQQGVISLPLLGEITAAGLTTSVLERSLAEGYKRYLRDPEVGVRVSEYHSQRISVIGAVRNPGVFQLTGPKTLVDLLAMAGGINERAGSQVHIYRKQSEGQYTYVVDLLGLAGSPELVNMPVQPGDVINVLQAGMFFVDGAVGRPGSYPLSQLYTLTQALAVAGGVNATLADYSSVAIFRRRESLEADRISVDLKEILAGRAGDPRIEANDVIVVPTSTAKYLVERFLGRIGLPGVPGPIW